jgi:transposase
MIPVPSGVRVWLAVGHRGRFIWPSPADGTVAITPAQLAYMLDGIDWRNPIRTWRPEAAGLEFVADRIRVRLIDSPFS